MCDSKAWGLWRRDTEAIHSLYEIEGRMGVIIYWIRGKVCNNKDVVDSTDIQIYNKELESKGRASFEDEDEEVRVSVIFCGNNAE